MADYKQLLYIDGQWTGGQLPKIDVTNPATGEGIGTIPKGGAKETTQAIDAAHRAFFDWSKQTATERGNYIRKVYELMMENKQELAEIMTLENGKPLEDSLGEVNYAASFLEWFAEEGRRVYGRLVPGNRASHRIQVKKQPVGVVGAITPWNFPAAMITRKMGPALASGCTFIVKPASKTPFTALKIMEYCEQAGIPNGVVNLITGGASNISETFMHDLRVRKITFTGSTEIGKILIKQSADQVKKLSLELGGQAPLIVLDDANLDKAVNATMGSKFRNGGQTCIASNRIYVHTKIYDDFVNAFAKKVNQLKVGNGLEQNVTIGPIIDKDGYEKVSRHVQDAKDHGGEVVAGGKGWNEGEAYFFEPTVIKDATTDMLIMNEETFGPIAPIQKIESDEEGIQLANDTPFGLAAYVFTESVTRGTRITEQLDFGIIGWNDGVPSAAQAPFGGMKESGIGREGGTEGIEEYLETKYISLDL